MSHEVRNRIQCRLTSRDEGSVLVISMFVMVLLGLIGLAATTTTTIEIGVAGNEQAYKENLYKAEGATMACAQQMENEVDDTYLEYMRYDWLRTSMPNGQPQEGQNWSDAEGWVPGSAVDSKTKFFAIYEGVAPGAHVGMDEPTLRAFSLYGRSAHKGAVVVLQVGYKKRF